MSYLRKFKRRKKKGRANALRQRYKIWAKEQRSRGRAVPVFEEWMKK